MIHCREDYNRIQDLANPENPLRIAIEGLLKELRTAGGISVNAQQSLEDQLEIATKLGEGCHPINEDEPVMLFRAKDVHFIPVMEHYASLVRNDPEGDQRIPDMVEAFAAGPAAEWQEENPTKSPDLPKAVTP